MPLLGRKIVSLAKPLVDIKPEETIFTIPHTGEQFRSQEDYEKRHKQYCERIWTCQSTGHINLTHEEAFSSEKFVQNTLKKQFPTIFEKPALELVHHSILSLDILVDQSWLKLQQCLSLDEKVSLKIKTTDKSIKGTVVKIDTNGVDVNPVTNCSSPSSDKENSSESGDSPKKWIPPKLLSYKYNIKLKDQDKVISSVPASDLLRVEKAPSKELLRLFIRSHALRVGPTPTGPWVVDDFLVKKYKLPSKFVDFLLSPAKMAENAKKAEAAGRKRKSMSKVNDKSNKKTKVLKSKSKSSDNKTKKSSSTGKLPKSLCSPSKSSSDSVEIYSESSDDEVLINLMPLAVLKASPKKNMIGGGSASSTPRKRGRPRKDEAPRTPVRKSSSSNKGTPSKRKSSPEKKAEDSNKRISPRKKKKPEKMKQMTLFDLKSQKTPTKRTPDKRNVATPPRTPWVVTRILKAKKEGNRVNFNTLTTKAAKDLTAAQRSRLPEEIKEVILDKYEKFEEKRKLKKMSPAERETYLQKRKEEKKKKLQERIKAKNVELKKRYEDQDLELKPLPAPKLVPTHDSVPNEMFGDVAQLTEFISSYVGLLMPDEEIPIMSDGLLKALGSGAEGFVCVSQVLKVLLQTLLQDGIAEYYAELDTPLGNIAVTNYTTSELVRLCLRKQDDDAADNDIDAGSETGASEESEVPEEIIQLLETKELYELTADQKMKILKGLCLRIMGTYSVQDYMEEKQKEASELWKKKMAQLKAKNIKKKADKKSKEEDKVEEKVEEEKVSDKDLTITHFYGKKGAGTAESTPEPESKDISDTIAETDPSDIDLAGMVKRRRVLAARAAAERVVKDKEDKIRREKDAVEFRKQRELELFEKSFNDGLAMARLVLRQSPIGTDRDHNRYWVFTNTTPGLFVEKGWVSSEIEYSCRPCDKCEDDDSIISSDEDDDDDNGKPGMEKSTEKTFPNTGQNLWFMYDNVADLESLIENLHPNGIRESLLKAELKKRSSDISRAINIANKETPEEKISDGKEEMLAGFKKELSDLELRLRNGGLGGVPNFSQWEAKLMDAKTLEDMASCLNETQLFTMEKFLKGIFVKKEKKGARSDTADGDVTSTKTEEQSEKVIEGPQTALDKWREALENCQTISRLHVLMGIFDSSIKWEKSAENAKCKICRKKGDDSMSLLCDDCNLAFHLYCLRPALLYIPEGEWFCPACRPQSQRRRPEPGTYRDMNGESSEESGPEDDDDSSDEEYTEEIVHDENCLVCGGDEGLAFCSECPSAFHLDCHNPPLRHTPRSNWVCIQCKTGVRIKTKRKPEPVPTRSRKCYDVSSDEEEEESEEEESEEEEASDAEVIPKSQRRGGRAGASPSMRSIGTTTGDFEKVIIPTKYKTQQKRTESRRSEPPRRTETKKPPESRRSEVTKVKEEEEDPYTGYMRPTCKRGPSDLSLCEQILGCLFRHKSSWPFHSAVNKKEVPDYHTIIKKPMDFQSVKNNILCFVYSTTDQFVEDVSLVFRNAAQYNKIDSEVYTCMLDMEECFTELLRKFLPECRYERETTLNGYGNTLDSKKSKRI